MSTKAQDNGEQMVFWDASGGLTKREYFASAALAGMLVHGFMPTQANCFADNTAAFNYALAAVRMADALLEELAK